MLHTSMWTPVRVSGKANWRIWKIHLLAMTVTMLVAHHSRIDNTAVCMGLIAGVKPMIAPLW
jgi:hypothetical protein